MNLVVFTTMACLGTTECMVSEIGYVGFWLYWRVWLMHHNFCRDLWNFGLIPAYAAHSLFGRFFYSFSRTEGRVIQTLLNSFCMDGSTCCSDVLGCYIAKIQSTKIQNLQRLQRTRPNKFKTVSVLHISRFHTRQQNKNLQKFVSIGPPAFFFFFFVVSYGTGSASTSSDNIWPLFHHCELTLNAKWAYTHNMLKVNFHKVS